MRSIVSLSLFAVLTCLLIGCSSGSGGSGSTTPPPVLPQVASISPTGVAVGSAAQTLTVTGSNFVSSSIVQWNGVALTTTFVSANQLTAQLAAADFISSETVQVTVSNPGSSGGTSNAQTFTVQGALPILSSVSPTSATAGGPAITLTITGSKFDGAAQVQWNGAALSTTYVSSTQLTAQVPATDIAAASSAQITVLNPGIGGQSNPDVFYINSGATRLQTITANANQLVWDASHGRIYATLAPTNNGANNNTVASINPLTASIVSTTPAGSVPDLLALSSDASYLWVGEDGSSVVQRFTLPNFSPDISIPIPASAFNHAQTAVLLQAAPDNPHTVAISLGSFSSSPINTGGTAIYDDSTPRPSVPGQPIPTIDWLQWGADSTVLYGGSSVGVPTEMYQMSVNSSGITVNGERTYAVPATPHFDALTGFLYSDFGHVTNPVTFSSVGNYDLDTQLVPENGISYCAVDSAQGLVFFLIEVVGNSAGYDGYAIQVFDLKTFRLLRTLQLPQFQGTPVGLIRWGSAGLAFNVVPLPYATNPPITGTIYLIDGAFVNGTAPPDFTAGSSVQALPSIVSISPQSATAGSSGTTLTINGTNFENGSVAYFGKTALQTTYVNAGQLQASVPSSILQTAGSNFISVSNGDGSTLSVNNLNFTTLPAGSTYLPINLSAFDLAWDSKSALLYAAVLGYDTQYPNTIAGIDPSTGKVVSSQFVGSDPDIVRATSDGSYLYAASFYGGSVSQLPLPTLSPPLTWSLGSDGTVPNYIAEDLQPAPGAPQTIAVATYTDQYNLEWFNGYTGQAGGVFLYDNNVPRSTAALETFANTDSYYGIQWGADASTLYSFDSENLYTFAASPAGVVRTSKQNGVFTGIQTAIRFDPGTGYLYDDTGRVLDPATGSIVGNFNSSGLVVPDSSLGRVFILGKARTEPSSGNYTITAFDQKAFTSLRSITIPSVIGIPVKMVRWGTSGLAFVTYANSSNLIYQPWGMLYIINDPTFVSAQRRSSDEPTPMLVQKTWTVPQVPLRNAGQSSKAMVPTR